MKLRFLFIAHAVISLVFGIVAILFPTQFIGAYGGKIDDVGIVLTRIIGGMLIGYSAVSWFVRNAPASETRRGVVMGYMISFAVLTVVYIVGALGPAGTSQDWFNVVLALLFTLGYGYYAFLKPNSD